MSFPLSEPTRKKAGGKTDARVRKIAGKYFFWKSGIDQLSAGSSPKGGTKRKGARQDEVAGKGYRFYCRSCEQMPECKDGSIALTITSPPYWNAIDYDLHAAQDTPSRESDPVWYRERAYSGFGDTLEAYLDKIGVVFAEVLRATKAGGFCAIVVGTLLHERKHIPIPMLITERMLRLGWDFHQDIVWNKVTGGVKRAGCFIQRPRAGYYYPNIMCEYILVFRKAGAHWRDKKDALAIDDVFKRDIANNIWHIAPVPPRTIDHPCPYPEELARRLVLLYSCEGEEVLDPFLGSGQTALEAKRYGRLSVGYDTEKHYIALAKKRLISSPPRRKYNLVCIPAFKKILRHG